MVFCEDAPKGIVVVLRTLGWLVGSSKPMGNPGQFVFHGRLAVPGMLSTGTFILPSKSAAGEGNEMRRR